MALYNTTDIESIGGGGMGGFGANPLLWLITLGFLKGNDGFFGGNGNAVPGAGVLAGETQGKLDCLQQQHAQLSAQIASNNQANQFQSIAQLINSVGESGRDGRFALNQQINDLRQQLADCCCSINDNVNEVQTQIAQQTSTLLFDSATQTQKILDKLCDQETQRNRTVINDLERQLQTQTILNQCNCNGSSSNGTNIDINVLAAALMRGAGATATVAGN